MGVVVMEPWYEARVTVKMRHAGHEPACVNYYYYCRIMLLLGYYRCYQIFIKFYYQIIIDVIIICSGSSLLLYIYL